MVLGREGDIVIDDEQSSRRHAVIEPTPDGLRIDDLGSSNGTFVNGQRITGPVLLGDGDLVTIGLTMVRLVASDSRSTIAAAAPPPPAAATTPAPPAPTPAPPTPAAAAAPAAGSMAPPSGAPVASRAALDALTSVAQGNIVVRFEPGTPGERASGAVLAAAVAARQQLAGLGSESWGVPVQVCLVDPFPDPDDPRQLVTEGTLVDAANSEVWMVVTEHADVEPVGRALATVFGHAFPAHDDLAFVLEGYGLHAGGAPDPTPELRGRKLPPLDTASGDLGAAMSVGFVRHLLAHGGDAALRKFFGSARPGHLDDAATEVYGAPLPAIEAQWRAELMGSGAPVRPRAFMHLSFSYLKPHLRRQIEIFIYLLLSLAFTTVMPFVTKRLLDTALPSGQWSKISQLMLVLAGAFVVSLLAQVRQRYLSSYVSSSIVRSIRTSMFERMQQLSAGWYSRHDQGDVLSRFFSDVMMLESGLTMLFRDGAFQIVSLAVSVVVAFTLDWRLAIIVVVGAPLIAFVYRRMSSAAMRHSMAMQERSGGLMSVTAESFQAQQVVKAFSLAAREVTRFRRASDDLFQAEMKMTVFVGWFMLSVQMIVTILRIVVMAFGAWLILHGKLSVGAYVAFLGVMGQVLEPVTGLTGIGQELQQSMGALARVQEVMNEVPEVRDAADARPVGPLRTALKLEGVAFGYTAERRVLDGVDLEIPAGKRTAIVGPSGSGKSSLLQLISRAYDPDIGRVTWDGADLTELRLDDLRGQTGIVFQDNFAFDDSIRENIRMGSVDASDLEVEQAARQAELHEFILTMPQGYDTVVGERGSMLSGGQRQRLAIARALLRNPSLLLLDEATSALDARTERLIAATLDKVSQGRTTVAVTHRLLTVTTYDQIIVVVDGRIVERGTHRELLALGGHYAELWAEQGAVDTSAPAPPPAPTGGKRLTRMTGVLRALPVPTGPAAAPFDAPVRATGTFGPVA